MNLSPPGFYTPEFLTKPDTTWPGSCGHTQPHLGGPISDQLVAPTWTERTNWEAKQPEVASPEQVNEFREGLSFGHGFGAPLWARSADLLICGKRRAGCDPGCHKYSGVAGSLVPTIRRCSNWKV